MNGCSVGSEAFLDSLACLLEQSDEGLFGALTSVNLFLELLVDLGLDFLNHLEHLALGLLSLLAFGLQLSVEFSNFFAQDGHQLLTLLLAFSILLVNRVLQVGQLHSKGVFVAFLGLLTNLLLLSELQLQVVMSFIRNFGDLCLVLLPLLLLVVQLKQKFSVTLLDFL